MSDGSWEKREPRPTNTGMTPERTTPRAGERIDRETLAALVDGRLNRADRSTALVALAGSPDDLEIVADIMAVADELDAVADISPGSARRRSRVPQMTRWLAVAAALLLVAVLPVALRRGSGSTADGFAGLLAARTTLPAGWDEHAWSATRGANDGITERARAVRAGALASTIEVAAARGDSATPRLAGQMAALFVDVPGAGAVVSAYRAIAAKPGAAQAEQLHAARQQARSMVAAAPFDHGEWLEAARIAAVAHDSAFFTSKASRTQLAGLQRDASADARTREYVLGVDRLIAQRDWDALADTTTTILSLLAAP
jgi:hypothetical protein